MKGKKIVGWLRNLKPGRKVGTMFTVGAGMLCGMQASALDIVTKDESSGAISFDPTAIVDPVQTAIITTICSVAGIFLIVLGTRWVFRLCKGGR